MDQLNAPVKKSFSKRAMLQQNLQAIRISENN